MESEQLVADQVVSGSEGGRDLGLPLQSLEDLCSSPVLAAERRCGHALLVDLAQLVSVLVGCCNEDYAYLEPLLATAVTALVVTRTLVHPYHDRALCVGPLSPLCGDLASSSDLSDEVG